MEIDPIEAAQAKLLQLRSQPAPNQTSDTRLLTIFEPKANCRLCQSPLTENRVALCIECDQSVAEKVADQLRRAAEEDTERRMRASGLPYSYRRGDRTIGSVPMGKAETLTVCQMLGRGIRGLYLWGKAGTWKTSIAASWLAAEIKGGASGRYVFIPDLLTDLYAVYAGNGGTRAEIVDRLASAPLLVLDDLGKEKASEHAASVLFEILDGRYREHKAGNWLIVTSNYPLDELCDRFPNEEVAEPIRRRLSEMTVAVPME
jgi:DNA replication protein DnaC